MTRTHQTLDVPVAGGQLRVGRWASAAAGDERPPLLAVHGVTANHLAWAPLADQTDREVLAPDLRGRGRSADLDGPAGMAAHAADLVALLDQCGVERATLVGHSMGGFVAAAFAAEHPDRVAQVLLVDGGLPFPAVPDGVGLDDALAAIIGPAAERLSMTFADTDAYHDYWRRHPAIGPDWSDALAAYFTYDLVGEPPACRSSVSLRAVREDSADLLARDAAADRVDALPPGTVFLRAVNGMMGEPGGLYTAPQVADHAVRHPAVEIRDVPQVNHYSIVMTPQGARVVADTLTERVQEGAR